MKNGAFDMPNHSTVRDKLRDMKPDFWVEIDGSLYGALAIPNPNFDVCAMTGPLDLAGLHALPVKAASLLGESIKAAFKERSTWPSVRYEILNHLGAIYVNTAGMNLLRGINHDLAKKAGEAQAGLQLQDACSGIADTSKRTPSSSSARATRVRPTSSAPSTVAAHQNTCTPTW